MSYLRFGLMVLVSTAAMFVLMYLNTYSIQHVLFSQTRLWMALLMGAVMAAIMLGFMLGMYENKTANVTIFIGCAVIAGASLWIVRTQATIGDVAYMEGMIPHHSIAVLTSENAHIKDPRVRDLADGIIETQVREIAEMKALIEDIRANPIDPTAIDLRPTPTD